MPEFVLDLLSLVCLSYCMDATSWDWMTLHKGKSFIFVWQKIIFLE